MFKTILSKTNILIRLSVALLIIFTSVEADANDIDQLLNRLDNAVANRSAYINQRENKINELKMLLHTSDKNSRYEVCDSLSNLYMGNNTDSARHYSELCLAFARDANLSDEIRLQGAQIRQAQCMSVNGMYEQAKQILRKVEDVLFVENKLSFYLVMTQVYNWESEFSTLPEASERIKPKIMQCLDSVLNYERELVDSLHTEAIIKSYTDLEASSRLILPIIDTMSYDNPSLRFIANTAASNFDRLGNDDMSCYYYALSAYSDVTQGVMEHSSLCRLAVKLFAKGDVSRAYEYMKVCMEDARACGARLRTIQMAEDLPVILNAYQETISSQHQSLVYTVIVLAILLLVVAVSLSNIYKIQQRLKEANVKEQQINRDLNESNQIKQVYITNYMKQFSAGISKLESYQQMIQKVAHTSNYGKLVQTIKDTDIIDKELNAFYQQFDETFLGLFPTFVQDFNNLLRPDERLPEPEGGHLSTELRIFALIRLGIQDGEEIASFLRYSIKTIYNYRTKIRNKALGDRLLLEEKLMGIGVQKL